MRFQMFLDLADGKLLEVEQCGRQSRRGIGFLKHLREMLDLSAAAACDNGNGNSLADKIKHFNIEAAAHPVRVNRVQAYLARTELGDLLDPIAEI